MFHKYHLLNQLQVFMRYKKITNKVITTLPNSEQPYKGKVKTHKYINRQNEL